MSAPTTTTTTVANNLSKTVSASSSLLQCTDVNCSECLRKQLFRSRRFANTADPAKWRALAVEFPAARSDVPRVLIHGFVKAQGIPCLPVVKMSATAELKRRQLPNKGCINGLPVYRAPTSSTKPSSSARAQHLVALARIERPLQSISGSSDASVRCTTTDALLASVEMFLCSERLLSEIQRRQQDVPQSPLARFCTNARDVTPQLVPCAPEACVL